MSFRPGLTTQWFAIAAQRTDIWAALMLSLRVAAVATLLALVLGTCAAAALARARFFGRETISLLFVLPIALPGIITGIALRSAFNIMDFDFSFWTIVLGHATFCIVVVYNNAVARLRRTSPNLIRPRWISVRTDWQRCAIFCCRHGERCSRAACLPSRCRSTRSSSRPSRPDSNRRCQSGC